MSEDRRERDRTIGTQEQREAVRAVFSAERPIAIYQFGETYKELYRSESEQS